MNCLSSIPLACVATLLLSITPPTIGRPSQVADPRAGSFQKTAPAARFSPGSRTPSSLNAEEQTVKRQLSAHENEITVTRVWTNQVGGIEEKSSQYIHLSPGLNIRDHVTGGWKEARVTVRATPEGAVSEGGWFSARFAAHSTAATVFSITAETGEQLQGRVLGLRYQDAASGKTVVLAETRPVPVQITEDARIVYLDAFTGVSADLVYHVKDSGFLEQDVVIRGVLPDPVEYGLDPATTLVQAMTEFQNAPAPEIHGRRLSIAPSVELEDQQLQFGSVHMGIGRVFPSGVGKAQNENGTDDGIVLKQWLAEGASAMLVESVPHPVYRQIEAAAFSPTQPEDPKGKPVIPGVVLDFIVVPTITTYTFDSDETYRVTGYPTINNATFEGDTVLKYDPGAQLRIDGSLTSPSSGQAILTAVDDQTVGETVGTDPFPTGTYANVALYIFYLYPYGGTASNFQVRYAYHGIWGSCNSLDIDGSTFINCTRAIAADYTTVNAASDLIFCDVPSVFYNWGGGVFNFSSFTTLVGKNDNDADLLSNFEELVWWWSNPVDATTWHPTRKDGEYDLTAVTGQAGTRVSITVGSPIYNPPTDTTSLEFIVSGAFDNEYHEFYLYVSTGQFWRGIPEHYDYSDSFGNHYSASAAGNQTTATFAALLDEDRDFDNLRDGYEAKTTLTIVGNPDSSTSGTADGDKDSDADGLSHNQEWSFGTNPAVAESTSDGDGDGLPNWLESYIGRRLGVSNPSPWQDSDGDGVPNVVEHEIGADPATPDFGSWNPPPASEDSQFVSVQYEDVPYGAAYGPAQNQWFPSSLLTAGPLGISVTMAVVPSSLSSSGTADIELRITPLVLDGLFSSYVPPFADDADPSQSELQKPDPLDGALYKSVLLTATSLADGTWGQISDTVLDSLRYKTLEYMTAVSRMKISYSARDLQWLYDRQLSGYGFPGITLQIQNRINIIHTEATKISAITVRYAQRFPNLDWVDRTLRTAGWVSCALSWYYGWDTFITAVDHYWLDVLNHEDTAGPAVLSSTVQSMLQNIPSLHWSFQVALDPTIPIFDPNPLGWYDGGGGGF